jgi:hypothetical protein
LLEDKRLILLIWLTNEYSNQEVIGQVNIKLSEAVQLGGASASLTKLRGVIKEKKIILANTQMGVIDGEFEIEIKNGGLARRTS